MAEFDTQILTLGLAGVTLLLTAVVVLLVGRVNRLTGLAGNPRPQASKVGLEGDLDELRSRLDHIAADLSRLRSDSDGALRRVGVVRYDAFRDMGGHMSFSVALVDAHRNGLVISILNGRDGSRGYAKPVREGRSPSPLSTEEQEALEQALDPTRAQ